MKKCLGLLSLTVSTMVSASWVSANELTIRLSDEAVSAYLDPAPSATNSVQLGAIYNDEADGFLLSGGLFANGQQQAIKGRLGGKLYYADTDGDVGSDSGYGVALGGDFNYAINPRLNVNAGAFVGPSVLTFSDLDGYEEYFVRVNYKVFDTARIGVGYGSLDLEPEDGAKDIEMEDGFFVEMNMQFK